MSVGSRETVAEVYDRLRSSLLTLAAGDPSPDRLVEEVVVHGAGDALAVTSGAIVFGVGAVSEPASTCELLRELGHAGAVGLVMRSPVRVDAEVASTAVQAGVPLFGLIVGVPWMYLVDMVRPTRGLQEEDGVVTAAGLSADLNLFKVANTLSEILDAPVTIEDPRSRVLAFSANQERGDDARKAAVLGQQVPTQLAAQMARLGVFQRLYSSDQPIYVEPLSAELGARVAMQIRGGDALLGSIWAIAGDEPLTDAQADAMVRAANTAAAAILQGRIAEDTMQRVRVRTVAALIDGGQAARAAASRVHRGRLRGGCVLAVRVRAGDRVGDGTAQAIDAERLASSLVMFVRARCTAAVAAVIDDTIYAVLLNSLEFQDVASVRRLVRSFLDGRGDSSDEVLVGIGNTVSDAVDLDRSREDAELVLRVLEMPGAVRGRGSHVATRDDVHGLSLVLRLSDIAAGDPVCAVGPLARLETYDTKHQSHLVETLACWLEQFGDVTRTAEQLHVHKNTLRYRLGRIEEVSGVTLEDSGARFELMLQFRVRQSLGSQRSPDARRRHRQPMDWPTVGRGHVATTG